MIKNIDPQKYEALIRKIKVKKRIVLALMILAAILILIFGTPLYINIGDVFVDRQGLPFGVVILLALLAAVFSIIANSFIIYPVVSAMDVECDPEKHLVLNSALNRQKSMDHIFTVDYFYLGDFSASLGCAERMTTSANPEMVGLFNLARCHFFMGNLEALCFAADSYEKLLVKGKSAKPHHLKLWSSISLMVAIAQKDMSAMENLKRIEPWNNSKATEGFVNYLMGVAAYELGETQDAIYRFGAVKEFCSKTILSELSQEYLNKLK